MGSGEELEPVIKVVVECNPNVNKSCQDKSLQSVTYVDVTRFGGGAHLMFNTFNRPKLTSSRYVLTFKQCELHK